MSNSIENAKANNFTKSESVGSAKVYIASPFFTPAQVSDVDKAESELSALGIRYFSPRRSDVSPIYDKLKSGEVKVSSLGNRILKNVIFKENIDNIEDSGILLANSLASDGVVDSGTMFEVGYALGLGKTIVPFNDDNLYKIINFIKSLDHDLIPGTIVEMIYKNGEFKSGLSVNTTDSASITVIAETTGEYIGLSKVLVGYLCATRSCPIHYIDVPRKSNLMLSCACYVRENRDLRKYEKDSYGWIIDVQDVVDESHLIDMGEVDE